MNRSFSRDVTLSLVSEYRGEYKKYYQAGAAPESPKLRDSNPSVVIIRDIGLFGFGKTKKEAQHDGVPHQRYSRDGWREGAGR